MTFLSRFYLTKCNKARHYKIINPTHTLTPAYCSINYFSTFILNVVLNAIALFWIFLMGEIDDTFFPMLAKTITHLQGNSKESITFKIQVAFPDSHFQSAHADWFHSLKSQI